MRYDVPHDRATLEYQYPGDCFTWRWPDIELHVYFNEVQVFCWEGDVFNRSCFQSVSCNAYEPNYCDHALSVVHLSSLFFHIFDFSSETADRNSMKLTYRKKNLNVLNKVCVFLPIRKTRWPPLSLISWDNSTYLLKPLNGIQQNLTRSKILMSSTKFCNFRVHQKDKTVRLSWSLIGWDIIDFSSETAERYSMKLYRQQDLNLNVLFQVCVFSPLKPLNRIQWKLTGSKISTSSTKFVFIRLIRKKRWPPGLWLAETFSTSPLKLLNGIQGNLTWSKIAMSSTKFMFFMPIGK